MKATRAATRSWTDRLSLRALILLLPLALAACGDADGGSPSEAQQLDDAARATDINTITANATEPQ